MKRKKIIIYLIFIISVLLLSCSNRYRITTSSMEPTLLSGDIVKVNFSSDYTPQHGDIVIHYDPQNPQKKFPKRCIAIAGDDFHIKDCKVILNGKELKEPYVKGCTNYQYFPDKKLIEGKVPSGHIVVLGDNRENSYDSRSFGYIKIEKILGKAEKDNGFLSKWLFLWGL